MGLINLQPTEQPRTTAAVQAELRGTVSASIDQLFAQMRLVYTESMKLFWSNSELTPQQAFDSFGTDAAELLRLAEVLTVAINGASVGTITQGAPRPLTINADGTVTVGS